MLSVSARHAVVEVDPIVGDAERVEGVALGGEVLFVGRAAGVADQRRGHPTTVTDSTPLLRNITDHLCET